MTFRDALVLYVDDDDANRVAFEYVFEDRFRFALAGSAEEALELIEEETPAVLLADQRMPGMTGVALCTEVRRRHPGIIRMILTAYADLTAVTEAINEGAVHRYLRKPYDPEELVQALASGVTLWRERKEMASLEARMLQEAPTHLARLTEVRVWHELNNLVAPLHTHIQLLEETIANQELGAAESLLGDLQDIHSHLRGYVERLRAVPKLERCAGGDVMRRACRLFQRDHPMPQVVVEVRDEPLLPIGAVPLTQVVYNLLKNSERFGATRVEVGVKLEGAEAVLTLHDDGPGVASENAEKIFDDRFTTHREGHGIGLPTSRGLVEQGGGTLELVPSERGARFELRFPAL